MVSSISSAFYIDREFRDSLAGRKILFYVRTLSFREVLRFKNENELAGKDFSNISISEHERLTGYFYEYMTYGGYPRVVLSEGDERKGSSGFCVGNHQFSPPLRGGNYFYHFKVPHKTRMSLKRICFLK